MIVIIFETMLFLSRTVRALLVEGTARISNAALLGQYVAPDAMYYDGERYEEQTRVIRDLCRQALATYEHVIHLDQHSGYGPRYQMSITLVPQESRTSAELASKFNYPLILKGNSQEFYETHGDMTAYLYKLRNAESPGKQVFATAFEFGTYGDSFLARLLSLRAMIFASQLHAYRATNKRIAERIRKQFKELYFPAEAKWREKTLTDCRQAFVGILSAHNLVS